MITISQELQLFLEKELLSRWDKRIIFTPEIKISKDFGLQGEDAEDFILHFMKEFNIVFGKNFNFKERFYPEFGEGFTYNVFGPLMSIFNFFRNSIDKNSPHNIELKDLSVEELQQAINKGILE